MDAVCDYFKNHAEKFLGVTESGRFLGLVARAQLGFLLGSRFGYAVYARRPIREHLQPDSLVLVENAPLADTLNQILKRTGETFYEDVALVDEQFGFLGIIPVERLIRLQGRLMSEKTELIQRQSEALEQKNGQLFNTVHQLRQSQGRFDILFQNTSVGVALLNVRGEMDVYNQKLQHILDVWDSSQKLDFTAFISPEDHQHWIDLLKQLEDPAHQVTAVSREFAISLAQKGKRYLKINLSWIHETGQICALVDDVSQQRILERSVSQKEKAAMLESLVGGIAHEINNKMAPITGYAELLMERTRETNQLRLSGFAQTIRDSAMEAAQIIRQLLQLSKPAQNTRTECDLCVVIEEAVRILQFKIRESKCMVDVRLPSLQAWIMGDSTQLKQVIINLALNAMDAMKVASRKQLTIRCRVEQNEVLLEVRDTGQGIKKENVGRIFDPFYTTKSAENGTGLGLTVCSTIVKHHGADISVASVEGEGSCFTLTFPAAAVLSQGSVETIPSHEVRSMDLRLERKRILVVDDEEFITSLVQEVLRERLSCSVERAADGLEAIRLMEECDYDLIISDVRMPKMDGFGLLECVRKSHVRLLSKFVFITGDAGSPELNSRLDTLGVPVIRKPFVIAQFVNQCLDLLNEDKFQLEAKA